MQPDREQGRIREIRESIVATFRFTRREVSDPAVVAAERGRHAVPSRLTIRDVMEGDLAAVRPETSIRAALALMIENRISSVPVVDRESRIVGALNEKDLMKVFYRPDADCVGVVMTPNPVSFPTDAPLVDVVDSLMSSDFRRVLIHEDGKLVGVITRSHLMPALLAALDERERFKETEPH